MIDVGKTIKKTKVVVAMSGGVDSSVVAALLKEKGYDVIGITLQLYDHSKAIKKKGACCAGADIMDAKKVAQQLDFPHYVLNYEDLFKQSVIDDFVDSYLRGETPIPCIRCNQSVKFRDLLKVAQDLGADALATGHYVQKRVSKGISQLYKAIDENKDQSYFLFATTKEQLDYIYFPLGSFSKDYTRKEAIRLGLDVADKPDSQDICFVPNGNYSTVVKEIRPSAFKKGKIIHMSGQELGIHNGIVNYTIGQRKGLGISSKEPLYVIKINAKDNEIIVGSHSELENKQFVIKDVNWLAEDIMNDKILCTVKLRSTHIPQKAQLEVKENNIAVVNMSSPTRAVTKGQACVIYQDDRVLGGGWIDKIVI